MQTPDEAIAELHHCKELGIKAIVIPHGVVRTLEQPLGNDPDGFLRTTNHTVWFDTYGIDSPYDYDPVWATFLELGYAVTCHHGISFYAPERNYFSNHAAGHIGSHAGSMNRLCKSLYFGGVTRRFPGLQIAFLECGVSWAAQVLCDVVEHWEKRNLEALAMLDPARIDVEELADLFETYGGPKAEPEQTHADLVRDLDRALDAQRLAPEDPDNFGRLRAQSKQDIVDLFTGNFYFGCEADDRMVSTAFYKGLPRGGVLKPIFSSDIAHWDVTDMTDVLPEAYEQVEDGLLTEEQFRKFMFENPATLHLKADPSFFDGTAIEAEARSLLA
jgi:predicted TIM-barrel fold metal-dependent hydrolase